MTQDEQAIRIAADSVQQLRKVDVYRVLETCSDAQSVADYIVANRPDLKSEVIECLAEMEAEDYAEILCDSIFEECA